MKRAEVSAMSVSKLPVTVRLPALIALFETYSGRRTTTEAFFLFVGSITTLFLLGYNYIDFTMPMHIVSDHFYALTEAKNYINGHGFRFNPNLGYPGIHDDIFFTTFDSSYKTILWLGSRLSNNPFT